MQPRLSDEPGGYLRDTPWLRAIGPEYIAAAYRFAREADPGAKLFYNDYNLEIPSKRQAALRLLRELEAAGVRVDAVGLQAHYTLQWERPPAEDLRATRLWPPNHKTYPYAAADLVEEVIDDCSELQAEDVHFTRATSDELDDGQGDGNTRNDVSFTEGCGVAFVRAERAGTKNGRVYELFLQVEDDAGNPSDEARFRVRVAHDQAHAPDKGPIKARYACDASCAPAPTPACVLAPSAEVAMREGKQGPSLRFRAQGFAAGSVSDEGNRLCLYVDDALAGGSAAPDKVKVRDKAGFGSLKVSTKGSDLEIPALPIEGDVLRVELHDAAAACVASSFDAPLVNEAGRYEAQTE